MKQEILQNINDAAKKDFKAITSCINSKQNKFVATSDSVRVVARGDVVTASCNYTFEGSSDVVEASIEYSVDDKNDIYADSTIDEVASAILSSLQTPIMAADDDEVPNDAFDFDDFDEDVGEEEISPEGEEFIELEEGEEIEDPETEPNIETDNNIAGHYIVECDRCHGVFISALVESDQVVDHISGICPLCEKESDQYIKWVVKPVEF